MAKLSVNIETVREESDPEGGCFVVRVGERVISFVPNMIQADLVANTLRKIILEAKASGK